MQLIINRKELLRGLVRTHSVADKKGAMPILSNVLLSTDGLKSLRISATDLYLSVSSTAEADIQQGGMVAVSAKNLFDIVRSLPEGEVKLNLEEQQTVEIRSGKVRFRVPTMSGSDFPALPSPGESEFFEISLELIGRLIGLTHYSMSNDETRPHLSGAMFEGDGKILRMITTDGHRLSKAEYKRAEGGEMLNFNMLIPNKGVIELKRLVEDLKSERAKGEEGAVIGITKAGGNAFFKRDDFLMSIKLTEEEFPPYSNVIPSAMEKRISVDRNLLMEALKRISLVARDKSGVVRFTLSEGCLGIESENPEIGEGAEEIDLDYAGESLAIGFNARYWLEVLGALTEDEVAIELSGELDPGVIKPAGKTEFVGVIMPMRI
ncbi:MAG: DNA polymerase III subunit beta [Deltaproteobacteria bacterium]|nr:DNA polymerase III subunit beta [Deltaproteobacteria bacterium]